MNHAGVVREINHRFAVWARFALRRALSGGRRAMVVRKLAVRLALFAWAAALGLESLQIEFFHLLQLHLVLVAARGTPRIVTYLVHRFDVPL